MAARCGLLDLAVAFELLKETSFHYRQEIMDQFPHRTIGLKPSICRCRPDVAPTVFAVGVRPN
jgi:hypothetical protein